MFIELIMSIDVTSSKVLFEGSFSSSSSNKSFISSRNISKQLILTFFDVHKIIGMRYDRRLSLFNMNSSGKLPSIVDFPVPF